MASAPTTAIDRPLIQIDKHRWRAVESRDGRADGSFVFAVRTTGVYCRPSCPARRARREHVEFHRTAQEAQRAGFRACKRCCPDEASVHAEQARLVSKACKAIEVAVREPSLTTLARVAGLSASHFQRVFKSQTGVSPKAYASAHRAARVRGALSRRSTVTSAIYESGFKSSARFYAGAVAILGMTPTEFRKGGAGMRVVVAVGRCSLGSVLVAATQRGIAAIDLGESSKALRAQFERRFPQAEIVPGDDVFEALVAQVTALVDQPSRGLGLPLDVRGTAFQHRVWQALRSIPMGETRSYTEIATQIGAPTSARAVARACATNPVAVAIPCHRVVRSDSSLADYRWGIDRKAALLKRERATR